MAKPENLHRSSLVTPPPVGGVRPMKVEVSPSVEASEKTEEIQNESVLQNGEKVESVTDAEEVDCVENSEGGEVAERLQRLLALKNRLNRDSLQLARRSWALILVLVAVLVLLGYVLKQVHYYTVGRYAVLEDVSVTQNRGNQGQVEISYRVMTPGRVHCSRISGKMKTDLIYDYQKACEDRQSWNWNYVPGEPIQVTLWSRKGARRVSETIECPTSNVVDIVILMDTTESMDSSIQALKEKCQEFAVKLKEQSVTPRFALVGFGDAVRGGNWISISDFTEDVTRFYETVEKVARFDGGDLPESSLDALTYAIEKVKKDSEGHAIRFYLVTDQTFHPTTVDGKADVVAVGKMLQENRVMLDVFCRPQFREEYEPLLGDCGHFREIENFGEVLSQGRFLEN